MLTATAATEPQLRECSGCGLFQVVPALGPNERADCPRCGTVLRRTRLDSLEHCLALVIAALGLFVVLWVAMLMKVSTAGIVHETTLLSGPAELVRHGLWPLAIVWIVVSVGFGAAGAPDGSAIAWAAHIGGFAAGFLLLKPIERMRL